MRLFQMITVYRSYARRLKRLTGPCPSFESKRLAFLGDRYGSSHILLPVLRGDDDAFLAIATDEDLQRSWAAAQGMKPGIPLEDVLLAQIEHHRAEVFYSTDPIRFGNDFLRRLPGCVTRTIAWRAAPSPHLNFFDYDLVVSNFPSILADYRSRGARTAPFSPSHDPALDAEAMRTDRPTDVLFVGGYSQYHRGRALLLERVAALDGRFKIDFHLDGSRLSRLADSPLGLLPPLSRYRRPAPIRRVDRGPTFGRDLYRTLGSAKIVLNGAIDMAASERGNMRCFEALGAGCLMVSDQGVYPPGFEAGRNFLAYRDVNEAVEMIAGALADWPGSAEIAKAGHAMIAAEYSKERQWKAFQALV